MEETALVDEILAAFHIGDCTGARRLALQHGGEALWEDLFGPWNPDAGQIDATPYDAEVRDAHEVRESPSFTKSRLQPHDPSWETTIKILVGLRAATFFGKKLLRALTRRETTNPLATLANEQTTACEENIAIVAESRKR